MPLFQNISGIWKTCAPWMNVSGTWKSGTLWSNVAGVWKAISSVFSRPSGTYGNSTIYPTTASLTFTSIGNSTWVYTNTIPSAGASVDVASGGSAASITFSLNGSATPGIIRTAQWTVTATNSLTGEVANYTVDLAADNP